MFPWNSLAFSMIQWMLTDRFQGIRSDRVPEELWTEVCNTVQEALTKTFPKKKKYKKAKWLLEEALQIAEKGRQGSKEKRLPYWMQSFREQQGEVRKPF